MRSIPNPSHWKLNNFSDEMEGSFSLHRKLLNLQYRKISY